MAIKGYSVAQRKKVTITGNMKITKYALPNGRTSEILVGKDNKGNKVAVIISNVKQKPCVTGKRTNPGAVCHRKKK